MNKAKLSHREKFVITDTSIKPFDIIYIHTIGPFVESNNGNRYCITILCELTKYAVIIPVKNKEVYTIAKAIFDNFIPNYGLMKELRTDQGTEYKNEIMKNLAEVLKIKHNFSTSYHHEAKGSCERLHRTFNEYIRNFINDSRDNWCEFVKMFAYCYNTTPNTYHGYTPFELLYGRKLNLPEFLNVEIEPCYNLERYDKELKYKLQYANEKAKQFLIIIRVNNSEEESSPVNFRLGELIILKNEGRNKFDPHYLGPFKITEIKGVNCEITSQDSEPQTVHKNRLYKYNRKQL